MSGEQFQGGDSTRQLLEALHAVTGAVLNESDANGLPPHVPMYGVQRQGIPVVTGMDPRIPVVRDIRGNIISPYGLQPNNQKKPRRLRNVLGAVLGVLALGAGVVGANYLYAHQEDEAEATSLTKTPESTPSISALPNIDPYNVVTVAVMQGVNQYAPVTVRLVARGEMSIPVKYLKQTGKKFNKQLDGGTWLPVYKTKTFNLNKDAAGQPLVVSTRTSAEGVFAYKGEDNKAPFTYKKTATGWDIEVDASQWQLKGQLNYNSGNVWKGDIESFDYPRLPKNLLPDGKHKLVDGEAERVWKIIRDKGADVKDDPVVAGTQIQIMAGSMAVLEEGKTANQGEKDIDASGKKSMAYFIQEAGKAVGAQFNVSFKKDADGKELPFDINFLRDLKEADPARYKSGTETKAFTTTPKLVTISVEPTFDENGRRTGQ